MQGGSADADAGGVRPSMPERWKEGSARNAAERGSMNKIPLSVTHPEIAAQWSEKNLPLTPDRVTFGGHDMVWWKCEKGHEWKTTVGNRTRGSGCPYCSNRSVLAGFNDLATVEPKIAAQWAEDLNGSLTPEMVTYGSKKRVWWRCPAGHVWQATVYSRAGTMRSGCPVCAGKRARNRRIN